ncbi:MAG TPA: hypothetical protein VK555_04195 [Terriglobales bacterium]|jgi:hypothetical protein|nr:hypothetical protein [Terriglobales bacterium]
MDEEKLSPSVRRDQLDVSVGSTEKNAVRAHVFRFALQLGHCSTQSACLICARSRLWKIAFSLQFLVVCIPFTVYAGGDIEARRDAEHQGHAIAEDTRRADAAKNCKTN